MLQRQACSRGGGVAASASPACGCACRPAAAAAPAVRTPSPMLARAAACGTSAAARQEDGQPCSSGNSSISHASSSISFSSRRGHGAAAAAAAAASAASMAAAACMMAMSAAPGLLLLPPPAHAEAAAMMEQPYELDAKSEEARYDENLMTKPLKEFVTALETKGSRIKADELQAMRKRINIGRSSQGRVSLHARDGAWYSIRNDMQAPGFMLLRNEDNGRVFFLPPDEAGRLQQIDLSDDVVVAELFSNGAWFDVKEQLYDGQSGKPQTSQPLTMSAEEFSDVVSLLENAVEQ